MIDQERYWANNSEYIKRNNNDTIIENNIDLFSRALIKTRNIKTIMEYGCNIGLNLIALDYIDPSLQLSGVDLNADALSEMENLFNKKDKVCPDFYMASIYDFIPPQTYDMVFTKGVLIHTPPQELDKVYDLLYQSSKKYILLAEYFNPIPVMIQYRGEDNRLWKRDFAGEMIDKYKLFLIDYGFVYHRGDYPQDNLTWWLLKKGDGCDIAQSVDFRLGQGRECSKVMESVKLA